MRRLAELLAELQPLTEDWVAAELVRPARVEGEWQFSDADCARVRLIWQIRYDLGVEAETVSLVLSLLDQLYATRAQLNALGAAVAEEPDAVRRAIASRVAAVFGGTPPSGSTA
jgi:chaperone modulatory protein CbpM